MKPEDAIKLSDIELHDIITQKILKDNPRLRLGDSLKYPVAIAKNGKLLKDFENPEAITDEMTVTAVCRKINLADIGTDKSFIDTTLSDYLHPYVTLFHNREILASIAGKLGQTVEQTIINPTTYIAETQMVEVTQQMIDKFSTIIYRYGMSDHRIDDLKQ